MHSPRIRLASAAFLDLTLKACMPYGARKDGQKAKADPSLPGAPDVDFTSGFFFSCQGPPAPSNPQLAQVKPRSSDALLSLPRLWYNSYTLCDSISMSGRARAFGGTRSAELASRKYRRFSIIPITPTNVRTFPLSIARLAGRVADCTRSFLRFGKMRKGSSIIW